MISLTHFSILNKREIRVSFAIISVSLLVAFGWYMFPGHSQAGGTTDVGCGADVWAGINCSAGEEVRTNCAPTQMGYMNNDQSSFQCPGPGGFYWSGNKGGCRADPSCEGCVANAGCAANTCSTTTCSDSCGNNYAGTKNCPEPVYTCQDYGYQYGTVGNCWNSVSCSRSNSCGQSNTGMTTDFWGTCSVSAPSESGCPVIPPSCTNNSYCSGTTYISSDTCNGQTGSTPNSPSCGYVAPPSCTNNSYCSGTTYISSDTCNGQTGSTPNSPSCGYVAPPTYSQATYAPTYSESTYAPSYSQGTYAPVGCGTPAANLTAAPTRVRSGQTSTLTLSATGVTTSCTITGPGINTTVAASSCGVNTSAVTPPITSQVTYKVTCDGVVDISKIIVNLVPKVTEF